MKILIVEDDKGISDFVIPELEHEGYTTCLAVTGREALEKFESEKPVSKKYLVFASSYRECEKVWVNSRFSRGLPKTAAEFITFDNCPAAVKPYWNDVHFKRITLIGITLREFDKLYYGE